MPAADVPSGVAATMHDPVGYGWYWSAIAAAALLLVVGYYAGVLWWGRPRVVRPTPPKVVDVRRLRASYLARVDQIESQARTGRTDLRTAYQELSLAVRGYVEGIGALPALAMTRSDLARAPSPQLAGVVGLMYPPEFGPEIDPDDDPDAGPGARELLDRTLAEARQVISTWG